MLIQRFIWISILVVTGTYFRVRDTTEVESLSVDWLVYVQILVCLAGVLFGIVTLIQKRRFGFGLGAFTGFAVIIGMSSLQSPFPGNVIGYWILLIGGGLLTLGLVYGAESADDIKKLETTWWVVITILIFKDMIIALNTPQPEWVEDARLGMGVTHANEISLLSALCLILTYRPVTGKKNLLLWTLRGFYVLIMILAQTRIAMIGLALGSLTGLLIFLSHKRSDTYTYFGVVVMSGILSFMFLFLLGLINNLPIITDIFTDINRGQDLETMATVTGRTDIWKNALDILTSETDPYFLIFGRGYGMTRYFLNDINWGGNWYVYHAHNSLLELLLAAGILGALAMTVLFIYSLGWILKSNSLRSTFSTFTIIRASAVIVIALLTSLTETYLVTKMKPFLILFIFYMSVLDRQNKLKPSVN